MLNAIRNNNFSKAIDFILVNLNLNPSINKITINAIDMTLSADKTKNKIKKFVEEFCCFEDRYTDNI